MRHSERRLAPELKAIERLLFKWGEELDNNLRNLGYPRLSNTGTLVEYHALGLPLEHGYPAPTFIDPESLAMDQIIARLDPFDKRILHCNYRYGRDWAIQHKARSLKVSRGTFSRLLDRCRRRILQAWIGRLIEH